MNNAIEAQQRLMQAMQNYQKGDLNEAVSQLETLKSTFSNSDQVNTLLGTVYFAQRRFKDAQRSFQDALQINPVNKEAILGIGSCEKARGRLDKAEQHFKKALKVFPDSPEVCYNMGDLFLAKERFEEAIGWFDRAYNLNNELTPALLQQANIHHHLKAYDKAEQCLELVLDKVPGNPEILAKLNELRKLQDRELVEENNLVQINLPKENKPEMQPQENDNLAATLGISNVDQMVAMANLLVEQGKKVEAERLYLEALEKEPENAFAKYGLEKLVTLKIPQWHFDMLADTLRNDAFDKAIKKCVQKGDKVLDIGTGSGLLAMMAARSGAGSVLACEVNPDIAKVARKVISNNSFQNKIDVVSKRSDHLKQGEDFNERFDVIVSEILDSGGLGEGVIPSLRHAKKNLAKPNAQIIPAGISLKARLVEVPRLSKVNPVRNISGFDLSHFDEFRVSDTYNLISINHELHTFLSNEFSLRSYDFYNIPDKEVSFEDPEIENYTVECTENGNVHAVLFWFDLHMDETASYSSGPGGELIHWQQAIFYFDKPASVQKGQMIDIKALYSDWLIRFRLP